MESAVSRTEGQVDELATKSSNCLISFSGGKDSLVVAELVCKRFSHVEAFFMYLVPDLECVEAALEYGRKRWGFKIHMIPHWGVWNHHKYGVFCRPHLEFPEVKLDQIQDLARQKAGIDLIANGAKASDSMWRRRQLATWGDKPNIVYPLQKWNKLQVLGYLRARGIPLPDSSNKQATGVDLSVPSVLWLYDNHPADYKRLLREYHYAGAIVARRNFFGEMREGKFSGEE